MYRPSADSFAHFLAQVRDPRLIPSKRISEYVDSVYETYVKRDHKNETSPDYVYSLDVINRFTESLSVRFQALERRNHLSDAPANTAFEIPPGQLPPGPFYLTGLQITAKEFFVVVNKDDVALEVEFQPGYDESHQAVFWQSLCYTGAEDTPPFRVPAGTSMTAFPAALIRIVRDPRLIPDPLDFGVFEQLCPRPAERLGLYAAIRDRANTLMQAGDLARYRVLAAGYTYTHRLIRMGAGPRRPDGTFATERAFNFEGAFDRDQWHFLSFKRQQAELSDTLTDSQARSRSDKASRVRSMSVLDNKGAKLLFPTLLDASLAMALTDPKLPPPPADPEFKFRMPRPELMHHFQLLDSDQGTNDAFYTVKIPGEESYFYTERAYFRRDYAKMARAPHVAWRPHPDKSLPGSGANANRMRVGRVLGPVGDDKTYIWKIVGAFEAMLVMIYSVTGIGPELRDLWYTGKRAPSFLPDTTKHELIIVADYIGQGDLHTRIVALKGTPEQREKLAELGLMRAQLRACIKKLGLHHRDFHAGNIVPVDEEKAAKAIDPGGWDKSIRVRDVPFSAAPFHMSSLVTQPRDFVHGDDDHHHGDTSSDEDDTAPPVDKDKDVRDLAVAHARMMQALRNKTKTKK